MSVSPEQFAYGLNALSRSKESAPTGVSYSSHEEMAHPSR